MGLPLRPAAFLVALLSVAGVTRAVAGGPGSTPTPAAPGHAPAGDSLRAAAALGGGYWLVGADGNVYPFGVPSHGSLSGAPPARPIVGAAATPGGGGYWLVGTDGGVFSFGDARFFGSTGSMRLNKPIVGMAASPAGHGYWLVAADGGIFAFGDAAFYGSTGAIRLNKPITGMSTSMTGRGYRFVASDGGLFSFGDAPYAGSVAGRRIASPIVGMAVSPTGNGYWLAGSSGSVYPFGDGARNGSMAGVPIPAPIVAIASPAKASPPAAAPGPSAPPGDAAAVPAPNGPFQIALIGDTGYTTDQDKLLIKTRTAISSRPYAFVVHDGDIEGASMGCNDKRLDYVREVFDGFSMPFVYTPGDNEWADCSDPAGRLEAIRQRFFSNNQSLGQRRMPLTRQAAPFVENARWTVGNVVFATLNVPGPTGESSGARGLSRANIAWLNAAFDAAEAQGSPGVMIIWQDDPFDGNSDGDLHEALVERARQFRRPVVLVHGDTHTYRLGRNWREAPNLIELQTFAVENTDWWVEVTVDPASEDVFSFRKQQS